MTLTFKEFLQCDDVCFIDLAEIRDVDEFIIQRWAATQRNRLRYSVKKGYSTRLITLQERNDHLQDIHEINISADVRQGKPMAQNYKDYPKAYTTEGSCHHTSHFFFHVFSPP
jgi:hypothetical protein